MMQHFTSTSRGLFALTLLGCLWLAPTAASNVKSTLCVYDPSGANGDIYNLMKDFRTEALSWGVDFKMKPYTDEKTASEDFKAGQCKAALLTGTRGRPFQTFTSTVEALGALPSYKLLGTVLSNLMRPKAAPLMKQGDYEVAGIWPIGAIFLYVRDRNVNTTEKLAGKKIATLSYDQAAITMVRHVGASMVASEVSNFAGKFNNGNVDALYAPATAYKALELYRGIGKKGGVIRYPIAQLTQQLFIRSADFPEGFAQSARDFAKKTFDSARRGVQAAEKQIPASAWVDIPDADKARYDEMFRSVRLTLRDKKSVYSKKTLTLMRKVRCKADGSRAECADKLE